MSGCGKNVEIDDTPKPPPVNVTATCEAASQAVPHAAVVPEKTDSNHALRREAGQLDKSNENHAASRICQCRQRMRLAGNSPAQAESACLTDCTHMMRGIGYTRKEAAKVCRGSS